MARYLRTLIAGRIRERPLLYLLTVAGVSLGVASVVTVQLLNLNAIAAFEGTLEATTDGADLIVRPHGKTLGPEALPLVLGTAGVERAAPLQRTHVGVGGEPDAGPVTHLEVLGLDFFGGTAGSGLGLDDGSDDTDLITAPGLALTAPAAEALGVSVGDSLTVGYGTEVTTLGVGAVLEGSDATAFGVTNSAVHARLARERLGDRATIQECDFCTDPLPRGIDLAFGIESFVHAPDAKAFVDNVARSLRPGGRLALCDDFLSGRSDAPLVREFQRGWHASSLLEPKRLDAIASFL